MKHKDKDVIVEPVPPAPEKEVVKQKAKAEPEAAKPKATEPQKAAGTEKPKAAEPQKAAEPEKAKPADQPAVLDQQPWVIGPEKNDRARPDTLRTKVYKVIEAHGPITIEEAAKKVAKQIGVKYDKDHLGRIRGCFQKLDGDRKIHHPRVKKADANHK